MSGLPSGRTLTALKTQSNWIKAGGSWSGNERNCCFLNTGKTRFANISAVSGLDLPDDARGLALVDWDHDGDLDLWLTNRNGPQTRFMRNEISNGHSFLEIRLIGRTCNRDAIGSRVEVVLTGDPQRKLHKTLRAGDGYLSQSSKWLHFGLGSEDRIEKVTVRWPGGNIEHFSEVEPNQRYHIEQASGRATVRNKSKRQVELQASEPEAAQASDTARIVLSPPMPVHALRFETSEGDQAEVFEKKTSPVLLSIWASWCGACVHELEELAGEEKRIRGTGLDLVAVSVDRLDERSKDEQSGADAAGDLLHRIKFPYRHGVATTTFIDQLQLIHDHLFDSSIPLPVPTSFLFNKGGNLIVIYKGRVTAKQVLADLKRSGEGGNDSKALAAKFAGRWLQGDAPVRTYLYGARLLSEGYKEDAQQYFRKVAEEEAGSAQAHFYLGRIFNQAGRYVEAEEEFRKAIDLSPDNPNPTDHLATMLVVQGRFGEAEQLFRKALAIEPNSFYLRNNLGLALMYQRKIDSAIAEFRDALKIRPDNASLHENLGVALYSTDKIGPAEEEFVRAIELDPKRASARVNLAQVFVSRNQFTKAAEQMREILRVDPKHKAARANLQQIERLMRAKP